MTVVATDDFNRANGAVGANWTVHGGYTTPQIVSNAIASSAGVDYAATYSAANAGSDDMYAKASAIVSTQNQHNDVFVWARMPNDGTETGYSFDSPTFVSGSGNTWTLQRASSGTFTLLAQSGGSSLVPASTHTLEVRAVGTTITAYIDGSQVASVTDSTHSGATKRFGGIHVYADSTNFCSLDNFEMGNFIASSGPVAAQLIHSNAVRRSSGW